MKKLHIFRRTLQILVFLGFCVLPWMPQFGISGSLFALSLGSIPFADPITTLASILTGYWPNARLLLGAALALGIAFFLGRIFCSYLCPYGLLSESVHSFCKKTKNHPKNAYRIRASLTALAVSVFAFTSLPLLGILSFPGEMSLLPLLLWQGEPLGTICIAALLPILALCAEAVTGRRLWCQFICPQSVLLGACAYALPQKLPGLRIQWDPKACTCKGTQPCKNACSMGLSPRILHTALRRDCTHCGDCIVACQKNGQALSWSFTETVRLNSKK